MSKTNKKTIPTILGILILIVGIFSGVILLNARQIFKLGAIEDTTPKNIRFSNIENTGFTVSFITSSESRSFVKVGEDRYLLGHTDILRESSKTTSHYFEIDGLSPDKDYYVTVNVDGIDYFTDNPKQVKTGSPLIYDSQGTMIYGKVYSRSGEELPGAVVFAQNGNSSLISTRTSGDGSFTLNLSKAKSSDLSAYLPVDEEKTMVQLFVQYGDSVSSVSSYIKNSRPFPPIILGNNIELKNSSVSNETTDIPTPSVYGSFDYKNDLPFLLKNIYRERNVDFSQPDLPSYR